MSRPTSLSPSELRAVLIAIRNMPREDLEPVLAAALDRAEDKLYARLAHYRDAVPAASGDAQEPRP